MNIFLLYAHLEPQSFHGALKELAVKTLENQGHVVEVSDLYAMSFNPIASRNDFGSHQNCSYFKYSQEQAHAASCNTLTNDIQNEQTKLLNCDLWILQFPIWWYGFPAIIKGWLDRVLTKGNLYQSGQVYDRGIFKKKKALIVTTTGGTPNPTVNHDGIRQIVHYWNHGILYFLGFSVLEPFIVFSPSRMNANERSQTLKAIIND